MKKIVFGSITIVLIIIFWQLNALRIDNKFLFPYPVDVINTLYHLLTSIETYRIIIYSFFRLLIAISSATLLGIMLGIIAGLNDWFAYLLNPLITSLRTLPVASVIVVILILYGQSFSLYIITFLMLFPIIFESTKQGVLNIDSSLIEALRLEEKQIKKHIFNIYLPLSKPFIKTGLLQSVGIGFKVLVMAEFIAQSPISIGQALYLGRINLDYAQVFAWTIIIIVLVTSIELFINKIKYN